MASWQGWALASAGCAALSAIFAKMGVAALPASLATLIRTLVVVAIAALWVSARGEWHFSSLSDTRVWWVLVASGIATGLSWLFYFHALQLGPLSSVAPVDKLSIVLVVAAGWWIFGEAISIKTAVGAALVLLGSVLLIS